MTHEADTREPVQEHEHEAEDEAGPEAGPEAGTGDPSRAGRWQAAVRTPWIAAVLVVVLLVAGGGAVWLLRGGGDQVPDGTAFRLEGSDVSVTGDDVSARVDALQALYGVQVPTADDELDTFRRDAAKSMAVQVMLEDEADRMGVVVADKEVADTLKTLIEQRYPDGGRTAFVAALGDMGATEAQVGDEIRNQLLVSRLFDQVVTDVAVSDDELRTAFDQRQADLGLPVRRVLRNIVVADRATAARVLRTLQGGADFATVAARQSLDQSTREQGGSLGTVAPRDLEKAYAKAAFQGPVGTVFGPVKTQYGWNVGQVDRVLPAKAATFAGSRDALRDSLLAEQSLQVWRAWLAGVIKAHPVDYADDYRPADPLAVPDVDDVSAGSGGTDSPGTGSSQSPAGG